MPRERSIGSWPSARIDALCLVLIVLVSAAPYVSRLGFYSDDWNILSGFHFNEASGRFGFASVLGYFGPRPLQGLYLALLYKIFALHPLGYHLVNLTVLAACAPLLYWLMIRLATPRRLALAATILFMLLPQLSTTRVWMSCFQIALALLLMLVSLHCQLSFSRTGKAAAAAPALMTAVLSIASYEIFAPFLAAFALALAFEKWRMRGQGWRRPALVLMSIIAALALSTIAKAMVSDRSLDPSIELYLKGLAQLVRTDYDWRVDYGLNLFAAPLIHFGATLHGWGTAAAELVRVAIPWPVLLAATAIAGLSFWRLNADALEQEFRSAAQLLMLGVVVFILGHATFLIAPGIMFSPTGMANRMLVAPAIGVALMFVALIALTVTALSLANRRRAFAASVAIIAFLSTCRLAEIANYWSEAPAIHQRVIVSARRDLASLPAGSTVILDGVCPYHGPAVILETSWDISGALSLATGRLVAGDAVSPRMSIGRWGLLTSIYGAPSLYKYGQRLFVYNPELHLVSPIPDEASARVYFARRGRWPRPCPRAYVGHGELM